MASTTTIGDTPPPSPAIGDAWWDSVGGQLYIWFNDGSSSQWVAATNRPGAQGEAGPPGGNIHVGDLPPNYPVVGDAWFDSSVGELFVWYDDGSSAQWVVAHNQPGRDGARGPPGPPGVGFYGGGPGGPALPTPAPTCDFPTHGLESLYDQIQLQMPGLTTDNAVIQAWASIDEFYVASTYRREYVYWRMDPGVATLSFDPWDAHWRVFRFLAFRGLSRPQFIGPGRVRDLTWPLPDTTRNGEVLLALRPNNANAPLGDDFWAMWFDTVLAGAMGRLYLQPGKPYSDPAMGRVQRNMFSQGVAQARAHAQSMFVTDGIPWRYPYFAYGRSKNGGWGGSHE